MVQASKTAETFAHFYLFNIIKPDWKLKSV